MITHDEMLSAMSVVNASTHKLLERMGAPGTGPAAKSAEGSGLSPVQMIEALMLVNHATSGILEASGRIPLRYSDSRAMKRAEKSDGAPGDEVFGDMFEDTDPNFIPADQLTY